MIRSMTGFGKAEYKYPGGNIVAEIKAVNHRFYEFSSRMPSSVLFLDDKIRGYINAKVKRGKINLNIAIEGNHILEKRLTVNKCLAKKYYEALSELKKELGIENNVTLEHLVSMPDVITSLSPEANIDKTWLYLKSALDKALGNLIKTRQKEGAQLCKDLRKRINMIDKLTDEIKTYAPVVVKNYKETLEGKIKQISPSIKLDEGRLEQEVAMFAKNCDITEEITRLKAHIKSFQDIISTSGEAGRRLDFIAQELSREINTIGAKAQNINISRHVIQAKEEIEKIREQVQNVE